MVHIVGVFSGGVDTYIRVNWNTFFSVLVCCHWCTELNIARTHLTVGENL